MKPTVEDFHSLLADLQVGFDPVLTIVADASATRVTTPGGWAAAIFDGDEVRTISGCESNCTNNRGELQAFVHALWHEHYILPLQACDRVLCVSDSEVTVKAGRKEYSREGQAAAWKSLEFYERLGINFSWVWIPRDTNDIHRWCDAESRRLRLMMEGKGG